MRLPHIFKDPDTYDPDRFYTLIIKYNKYIREIFISSTISLQPHLSNRYSEGREEDKQPFAYLGFGAGMHACMGQQFGLMQVNSNLINHPIICLTIYHLFYQVKTILSILLRNFDLEPVDPTFPKPDFAAMVVGPPPGVMVRYRKKPTSYL